ncbi:MAG: glutamine-dependent synthetase [Cytophagaceae bacterium]|jgi:NAD+ synthase (glutamine-hydrolysing)|nr:glutamine-dependent synthetase [Cytophagaceae bacterium]
MSFLRIGGAALNQTPIDWDNNRNNILQALDMARKDAVKVLCLPELCITGYGCEDLFLHHWVADEAWEQLMLILPHTKELAVCIGLPVWHEHRLYNCACFIENGTILGFSAKQFLANEGVHYEPRWFTPWPAQKQSTLERQGQLYLFGDLTYTVQTISVAFEICEDAWRGSERPGFRYAKNNIQLILNPSASHFSFNKSKIRYELVIEEGSRKMNCAYIYADLLGNEAGRVIYDGEVLIAYKGHLIQRNDRLSFHNVELVAANIDFDTQQTGYDPIKEDQREKEYEFWEATCVGLYDYLRKSKAKGFVLSLSGGADSSVCAIMVYEMIRKGVNELGAAYFLQKGGVADLIDSQSLHGLTVDEQAKKICGALLTCVYQSSRNSGEETLHSAKELAESIGATFHHWSIDEEVESYKSKIETALQRELNWQQDDIALQNIQARSRSPIIWMMANIKRALLITTSNRSEGDVGYATMDGDTSGSIAPIAGVDKDFIRHWLKWAEKERGHKGLSRVNALTPTAELRPAAKTQTDEKDLMPYPLLAQIERLAIKNRKKPLEVYHHLESEWSDKQQLKQYIVKFYRLWSINQWKRERIAPSFHLDDFNVDPRSWCRFPILSGNFTEEINELLNS